MTTELLKGDTYHCRFCHTTYRYRGEVTSCFRGDCWYGANKPLTPDEVWALQKQETEKFND